MSRVALIALFAAGCGLALGSPITARAASCVTVNPGYSYTGFITCTGATEVFGFAGIETLISSGTASLPNPTDHIVEDADVIMQGRCGTGMFTECWSQGGWLYGPLDYETSGAYERPYGEYNDATTGSTPGVNVLTTVGVDCCSQTDYNDTSTSWTGMMVGSDRVFHTWFNNTVGSGNLPVSTAQLPGEASADITGEEYNATAVLPTVGPVSFANTQLDVTTPGVWTPWYSSTEPGEQTRVGNPGDYSFLRWSNYISFSYEGP